MGCCDNCTEPGESREKIRITQYSEDRKAAFCNRCYFLGVHFKALLYPDFIVSHREIKHDRFAVRGNKVMGNPARDKDCIGFLKKPDSPER
jgi:hypothetical protein